MKCCKKGFGESNKYCNLFRCPCIEKSCRFYDVMTNGDRVRAMSDEELARFLAGKFTDNTTNIMMNEGKIRTATAVSEEAHYWFMAWMQWLRMPVEDQNEYIPCYHYNYSGYHSDYPGDPEHNPASQTESSV